MTKGQAGNGERAKGDREGAEGEKGKHQEGRRPKGQRIGRAGAEEEHNLAAYSLWCFLGDAGPTADSPRASRPGASTQGGGGRARRARQDLS